MRFLGGGFIMGKVGVHFNKCSICGIVMELENIVINEHWDHIQFYFKLYKRLLIH